MKELQFDLVENRSLRWQCGSGSVAYEQAVVDEEYG